MATKKKAARTAPAKRKTGKAKKTNSPQTVKIIVEVVIKREDILSDNRFGLMSAMRFAEGENANNFSYAFERSNCTILKLVVERYEQDNPPDSGEFFTPVLDPNIPQKVRVMVVARQDFPGGNGRLTLKYKGKDVFTPAEEIVFSGGMGGINKLVNLPQ